MKHAKLWALAVLCMVCMLVCGSASARTTTVMMYMCGTDIQEDGLRDLQEICTGATSEDIRVVVLAGGTEGWSDRRLNNGRLNLFTIQQGQWSEVTDWGTGSMGSPDTLARFVEYCWQNCRGDRNMLIMWNHGSSAFDGLCFDELYSDDSLTVAELGSCFKDLSARLSDFHLDIVGADACLMGCYEMAVTLAPYADCYIGSEELEPWLGWYYTNWLQELSANSEMTSRELAAAVVNAFEYCAERDDPNDYLTLSAIDLSRIPTLREHINSLAATLTNVVNGSGLNDISRTVRSMYVFGSYDDAGSDMVDLNEFLTMCGTYDPQTAAQAKTALKEAVITSYASSSVPAATGLSIMVPVESSDYLYTYMRDYTSDALSGYSSFVTAFANAVSGGSYTFSASSQSTQVSSNVTIAGSAGTPAYGSGYGYNTSGLVIAGSAGQQTATAAPAAQDTTAPGGIVIAGSAGQQTATAAPAEATAAPTAATGTVASADTNGQYTFSVSLTDEDLHYLSYAELLVFQDFSDGGVWDLDELGSVRDTRIDWNNGVVYAVFDGTWPVIGDVYVVMYEQSRTDYGRRCIIPVMLNDTTKTYLVVEYAAGSQEGTILGTSRGWTENGLPVRGVTPLEPGDIISPIYPTYTSTSETEPSVDEMSTSWQVYNDPEFRITWDGTQKVTQAAMSADTPLRMAFRLHDIFGGSTTTALTSITLNQEN